MMRLVLLLVMLWLAGCALDSEEELRSQLGAHLYLLETEHFESKGNCTAGVFHLAVGQFREPFPAAYSVTEALTLIRRQSPVHLDFSGRSPHLITEAIMSADLPDGLGLISAGIGPARDCMTERILRGYTRVLVLPQTKLVYLPRENAMLLLYPPERLAFFLRGNV